MKGAWGNSESAVDAGVEVLGDTDDSVPLHKGEACTIPSIEEDMIDGSALFDCEGLMDHDLEPERSLIKRTRGPHVVGGQADVIDWH